MQQLTADGGSYHPKISLLLLHLPQLSFLKTWLLAFIIKLTKSRDCECFFALQISVELYKKILTATNSKPCLEAPTWVSRTESIFKNGLNFWFEHHPQDNFIHFISAGLIIFERPLLTDYSFSTHTHWGMLGHYRVFMCLCTCKKNTKTMLVLTVS